MDPVIHANILELLGAFFLGVVITIVIVWSLCHTPDDLDYDDSDEGDLQEQGT